MGVCPHPFSQPLPSNPDPLTLHVTAAHTNGAGVVTVTFAEDVSAIPIDPSWLFDVDFDDSADTITRTSSTVVKFSNGDPAFATVGDNMAWNPFAHYLVSPATFIAAT